MIDADANVIDQDGDSLPCFDIEQLNSDSTGYCFGSSNKTCAALVEHMNAEPFDRPCAIICKQVALEHTTTV